MNIYSPALSMALALPTLEVEGTNWVKQTELRKYASGAKKKCEEETEPPDREVAKPKGLGKQLDPDVQQVPKKRGRKPKTTEEPEESKKTKGGSKAPEPEPKKEECKKKRVRSKAPEPEPEKEDCKKKRARSKAPEPEPEKEEPKEKRARSKAPKKTETTTTEKDEEAADDPSKAKKTGCKAEQAEKPAEETGNPSARLRGYLKERATKRKADKAAEEASKEEPVEEPDSKQLKRALQSRKSAAYHRAYKTTEGSEDEKKLAARRAPCFES